LADANDSWMAHIRGLIACDHHVFMDLDHASHLEESRALSKTFDASSQYFLPFELQKQSLAGEDEQLTLALHRSKAEEIGLPRHPSNGCRTRSFGDLGHLETAVTAGKQVPG
jgi:hypothetical protein